MKCNQVVLLSQNEVSQQACFKYPCETLGITLYGVKKKGLQLQKNPEIVKKKKKKWKHTKRMRPIVSKGEGRDF